MNARQQQATAEQARQRAVALGEAGAPAAIPELIALCRHAGATVRRAAASALGKLAAHDHAGAAVPVLAELTHDMQPQVRQYALLALGRIGAAAGLPAVRDAAARPTEPAYVLAAALRASELIAAAEQTRQAADTAACSRCGAATSAAERDLAQRQFQRVYCHACFDAVFIERRNFDMKVQNHKTILTADRTVVQSRGERAIADWLSAHGVAYRYDDKFQLIQGYAIRPDFYLPVHDLYIEYWGLDTTDYKIGMLLKQKLYQQEGKRLLSLYPADLPTLADKLAAALVPPGATNVVSQATPAPPCTIRRATAADGPAVVALIHALADYEQLPGPDAAAEARLLADGFGAQPRFETWLAQVPEQAAPVGYAILFETYSTFLARPTLYLEDLFVLPSHRRLGIGSALLRHCVGLAHARGCGRMEWACLDWNTRAQGVYEQRLGARKMSEWLLYRLTQPEMAQYLQAP